MQSENKPVREMNVRVKDGDLAYAHETTINFSPTEFTFDFKTVANVQDVANHSAMIVKHSVVILTPHHAKAFMEVLAKVVKDYEKNFGDIKKPTAIEKAEKLMKKQEKKMASTSEVEAENYFG